MHKGNDWAKSVAHRLGLGGSVEFSANANSVTIIVPCKRGHKVPCRLSKKFPAEVVAKKLMQSGWSIGHNLTCPKHSRQRKTTPDSQMTDSQVAAFQPEEKAPAHAWLVPQQHQYQFLTKRPERLLEYARRAMGMGEHWLAHCERSHAPMWPLPNVWLGVSVEDDRVKHRIDTLRQVPIAGPEMNGFRWISFEPLIGSVIEPDLTGIDWAVVGGESGPQARFEDGFEAAALEIRVACLRYGVAYFLKQMTFKKPIPARMLIREMPA